jgi:uncharacterized delta-60 repeat protein
LEDRRLLAGGSLDPTFGVNGRRLIDVPVPADDRVTSMLTLPDGKLLATHQSVSQEAPSYPAAFLARFNSNGTLDSSFGNAGLAPIFNRGPALMQVARLGASTLLVLSSQAVDVVEAYSLNGERLTTFGPVPQGRIFGAPLAIVATTTGSASAQRAYVLTTAAVFCFTPTGQLDTTFGANGATSMPFSDTHTFSPTALALDASGRLLLAGARTSIAGTTTEAAVVRILPGSGAIDFAFGTTTGMRLVATGASTSSSRATQVAIDTAGRTVVSGTATVSGEVGFVARFGTSGLPDTSFNSTGVALLGSVGSGGIRQLRVDAQNRAVVVGELTDPSTGQLHVGVRRLTAAGQADATFDADGFQPALAPSGTTLESVDGIHLDAQGNVIVHATSTSSVDGTRDVALTRLRIADGARDAAFGTAGITRVGHAVDASNNAVAATRMTDGRVVVVGQARMTQNVGRLPAWHVARLNVDGSLDRSFGINGTARAFLGASANHEIYGVAVDASGRVALVGQLFADGAYRATVVRLTANGALDTSFGSNGMVRLAEPNASARTATFFPDGSLLVGGAIPPGGLGSSTFGFWKLGANGSPDTSFGTNGVASIAPTTGWGAILALHPRHDGRIIATGSQSPVSPGSRRNPVVAMRLLANGTLDATFGTSGFTLVTPASPRVVLASSSIDSSGRIYVASRSQSSLTEDVTLSRLTADGAIDPSFGTSGSITHLIGSSQSTADAFTLDSLGRVLIGATIRSSSSSSAADKLVIRLFADGTLDESFGTNGRATADVASGADATAAILPVGAGVVVVGTSNLDASTSAVDFSATRFTNALGDGTAPTLTLARFELDGAAPRVRLEFSEDVFASLAPSDIDLTNLTTSTPIPSASLQLARDGTTGVAISLPTTLADGNYRLRIAPGALADVAGTPSVVGNTFDFHVLAGDANRDTRVDFDDLLILASNYNTSGKTFSQGNFNYDPNGKVNFDDLLILAASYNASLAGAVAPFALPTINSDTDAPSPVDDILM